MLYLKLTHRTIENLLIAADEVVGIVAKTDSVKSVVHVLLCVEMDVLHDFVSAHVGKVKKTRIRGHDQQTRSVELCSLCSAFLLISCFPRQQRANRK